MPLIYNTCDCRNGCKDWTNSIYFSNKQLQGSQLNYYKNFKALNYAEIPTDRGRITNLFNFGGSMYFHTTDGLGIIKYQNLPTSTSFGVSALGGADLQFAPMTYLEGINEGFAGLKTTTSASVNKFGYFFIDEEANKIFRFTGNGLPIEISNMGISAWLKDNLTICNESRCHGEKKPNETGFVISFDPKYDLVYISKVDQGGGDNKASFTLSFNPESKQGSWESLHDWIPQASFNDRKKMYTIKDSDIWEHDIKDKYLEYYGEKFPFEIEAVLSSPLRDTNFEYGTVRAYRRVGDVNNVDVFFDRASFHNSTQGTGTMKIDLNGDNQGDRENAIDEIEQNLQILPVTKIKKNEYRFNKVHDNVISGCTERAMTISKDCNIYNEVNEGIFNCDKVGAFEGNILQDDHLVVRLRFTDNETEIKLVSIDQNTGIPSHE